MGDMPGDEGAHSREPVHGFDLSPEDERLLRGPVPRRALRWAASAVGGGARVRASEPLAGGTSSAVHALTVEGGDGRTHQLVLRRFVREDWLAEEPDVATREAAALELIGGRGLPTPALVAVDPNGAAAGVPAVLMSKLPGRIEWDPRDVDAFLRRLVEPLPRIHATPVLPGTPLPHYTSYPVKLRRPPAWATRPRVWLRAIERLDEPPPSHEGALIHRDYHPGNVLWENRRVSGLIDWVNASVGCPWADVGHCRVNLASELGSAAADRLLELFRAASGRTDEYDPYWDIAAAVGGLDEDVDEAPGPADERFLSAAVARL
jgi:aminoglycoside phosphotransferase (APT) family kinase protein